MDRADAGATRPAFRTCAGGGTVRRRRDRALRRRARPCSRAEGGARPLRRRPAAAELARRDPGRPVGGCPRPGRFRSGPSLRGGERGGRRRTAGIALSRRACSAERRPRRGRARMPASRSPGSSRGRSTTPARWRSSPKRRAGAETVRQQGSDSATRCRPSSGSATAAASPTVSTVWPDWRPTPATASAAVGSKARRRSFASHAAGGRYGPRTPRESSLRPRAPPDAR